MNDVTSNEPWYGAKCVFLHTGTQSTDGRVYEERVILVKASSFDEAISRAEVMAKEYVKELDDCTYTGFVNAFHIYDESVGDGSEVYSLMRTSALSADDYLNTYYDTGFEHTGK